MSAGVPAVSALTASFAGAATGGLFSSVGARAELNRAIPANAIAMRVSFRPRERSCAAPWGNLCCHHLRKSSTVRGSSVSKVPSPRFGYNCGDDLTSSGSIDSLPVSTRSRVFGAHWESRGDDSLVRGSLEGARKWRANSSTLMCGARPSAGTAIWSSLNANTSWHPRAASSSSLASMFLKER
jgi:hypothetical protein